MEDLGKDEIIVRRYLVKTQKYYYTKDHVWVLVKGSIARVGVTDYAQFQVDTLEQVRLPNIGDYFESQDVICTLEGLKGIFEVLSPLTGSVQNTNTYLEDSPNMINEDPYEEGWILELKMSDPLEIEDLLSSEDYVEYLEELIKEESEQTNVIHSQELMEEESIEEISEDELGYEDKH
jgi:glycine cleavage system H protein